jgi:hypothetical protein
MYQFANIKVCLPRYNSASCLARLLHRHYHYMHQLFRSKRIYMQMTYIGTCTKLFSTRAMRTHKTCSQSSSTNFLMPDRPHHAEVAGPIESTTNAGYIWVNSIRQHKSTRQLSRQKFPCTVPCIYTWNNI